MGEPTCLMQVHNHQQQQQPFSYTSGLPNNESIEASNPMQALGQSVSFGRFMTESLEWEKWSSFSHNRYVEEAERYSRPGSVAQKKAFFEAHYKNLAARKKAEAEAAAAAALLQQSNAAEEEETVSQHEPETMVSNSEPVVEVIGGVVDDGDGEKVVDSNSEMVKTEETVSVEKETEFSNETVKVEKSNSKRDQAQVSVQVTTTKKKKMTLSSSSSSSTSRTTTKSGALSKLLTKPSAPNATPKSKKPLLEPADKKRSTPKSLHMGVNFSPIREISRLKSTVIRKIDNSRFGSNFSSKPSKDCPTPLKTPIKVSKTIARQQPLETPCSANRRATTPINPSASASKRTGPKWRSLATDCSKFLSACRNKTRSPFSSTSFSFRTEERAAKRKEKLEEKFNANEAQEEQPKTKVKDKPESENGKLRPNFLFKARPLPDFYKLRKAKKDETNKVSVTQPHSPKPGSSKANPSKFETKSSETPNRQLAKSNNGSKNLNGKSGRSAACSLISRPKRTMTITHENTSPNIQYRSK